jgi:hypothetical protein
MWEKINESDIYEWRENLISIADFKNKYPSLYTLSISEGSVLKYIDSSNEEYLIWMNLKWNISLFNDIDTNLLDAFEEDALVELHKTKLEVNEIIDNIYSE